MGRTSRRRCTGWRFATTSLTVFAGSLAATAAVAQSGGNLARAAATGSTVSEIVVTAQKREESLQEVPIAVSVLDERTVESLGVTGLNDIAGLSPNLSFDANSARDERLTIRGVSSDTRFLGSESAVGLVVDGVFHSGVSALNTDFAEIARIEVLRGPQGTLFGRNTSAGLINIVTRRPGPENRFRAVAELGNYDHRKLTSSLSGPLVSDTLFGGVSVLYEKRGGYQEIKSGADAWDQDLVSGRIDLVWTPNADWDVRFLADAQSEDHSFPALDFTPEDRVVEHAIFPPHMDRDVYAFSLNAARKLSNGGGLRAIASHKRYAIDEIIDADIRDLPTEMFTNPVEERGSEQSLELQYTSPAGGRVEWLAGVYLQQQENRINGLYEADWDLAFDVLIRPSLPAPLNTFSLRQFATTLGQAHECNTPAPACLQARADVRWRFETRTAAAFANAKLNLNERLNVQVGGRISWERKEFDYSSTGSFYGVPGVVNIMPRPFFHADEAEGVQFTPRVAITYEAAPLASFYASAAKGYKSANFYGNVLGNSDIDANGRNDYLERLKVNDETSWTYEVGVKGAKRGFRYDLAAYYIVYEGLQTQGLLQHPLPGQSPFNYLANADFENYGAEAELHADLSEHLTLSFGAAYNHGEFTDYENCAALAGGVVTDCTGNRPVYSPELTGFGRLAFDVPMGASGWRLVGFGQARYRDSRYFTVTNDLADGAYWLVDAMVGLEHPDRRLQVAFWGENLTNTDYLTLRAQNGASAVSIIGKPRTYGLRLTFRH